MTKKSNFWDKRYSANKYVYGKEPNAYFKEHLKALSTGNILLVGEGEGRNAVYAAKLGWNVSAFDLSVEGKKKAKLLADENNVQIEYCVGELHELNFQREQFDVVAVIFTHFPPQSRTNIHRNLASYLRRGGIVIMEVFSEKQINYQAKGDYGAGPKDVDMLYTLEDIKSDFKNFKVVELQEVEKYLSEGDHHKGLSSTIQFVGIKNE